MNAESSNVMEITMFDRNVITVPVSNFHEKLLIYRCICFSYGSDPVQSSVVLIHQGGKTKNEFLIEFSCVAALNRCWYLLHQHMMLLP